MFFAVYCYYTTLSLRSFPIVFYSIVLSTPFPAFAEWFMFRILFLIFGSILLSSASTLSTSLAFYSTCDLSLGLLFLAIILLIQVTHVLFFSIFFCVVVVVVVVLTYKRVLSYLLILLL